MSKTIEENLAENGVHVSTTSGYSMYPMLRDRRDRVVILPTEGRLLKKYDLPLYKKPNGRYVLHRILRVERDCYVIRGDNTYELERVPFEWVLGYVSEFYRGEKHYRADARIYRTYAACWHFLYPVRVLYRRGRSFLSRLIKGNKKRSQ